MHVCAGVTSGHARSEGGTEPHAAQAETQSQSQSQSPSPVPSPSLSPSSCRSIASRLGQHLYRCQYQSSVYYDPIRSSVNCCN